VCVDPSARRAAKLAPSRWPHLAHFWIDGSGIGAVGRLEFVPNRVVLDTGRRPGAGGNAGGGGAGAGGGRGHGNGARVVRLETAAKLFAPGFRVGWLTAAAPLVEKFGTLAEVTARDDAAGRKSGPLSEGDERENGAPRWRREKSAWRNLTLFR
jgi:hypothetical protein